MTLIEVPQSGVVGLRAANPGPFTLSGTNSWIVGGYGRAWLVDPGPALEAHLEALGREVASRGGLGGIALTHRHGDHDEAVPALRTRFPDAQLAAASGGDVDVTLDEGTVFGPLEAMRTPGHTPDHIGFLAGEIAFTGDAVLGEGSVFIYPDPGALTSYLDGLRRLRDRRPAVLCPGHGPLVVGADAVRAKLDSYIDHRLDRERRLLDALDHGLRGVDELLDTVWDDAPAALRPAAAVTLAAHLDKLEEESRLPAGVERPRGWEG